MTVTDIINLILLHEGGIYTDDPADAGGPTRWGVTIPTLAHYRRVPVSAISAKDIQELTRAEAFDVYKFLYVHPFEIMADTPLRTNVIDMGVNAGVSTAIRLLQKAVCAQVDGLLGADTIRKAAARSWNGVYVGVRILYYENLIETRPANIKWRNGWHNRAVSFLMADIANAAQPRTGPEKLFYPRFGYVGKAYERIAA